MGLGETQQFAANPPQEQSHQKEILQRKNLETNPRFMSTQLI